MAQFTFAACGVAKPATPQAADQDLNDSLQYTENRRKSAMRITIGYGRERQEFEVVEDRLIADPRERGPDLADPAAAVRAALEQPFHFPALLPPLPPDDHAPVAIHATLSRPP